MFGLVLKSKYNSTVESYEHLIQDYKDKLAKLQKQVKTPEKISTLSTYISSDGSYKNEIWKPIPGTDWKVSNYCRFLDSTGKLSGQRGGKSRKSPQITIPTVQGSSKRYVSSSKVAMMVYAFNPNSFKIGGQCSRRLRFRDGNDKNTHLSNVLF